ncbi:MAG: hypothetical protein MUO26_09970 [Methanotrichaceae archaeon]|nr:hypothetical protein [Methanotrichaceae archaeon]
MTKFHVDWKKNPSIPDDLANRAKQHISLLETVKADLKSGRITDWGQYCNLDSGYLLMEGTEADILTTLIKWTPHILFDVKPVANIDQTIEVWRKA